MYFLLTVGLLKILKQNDKNEKKLHATELQRFHNALMKDQSLPQKINKN